MVKANPLGGNREADGDREWLWPIRLISAILDGGLSKCTGSAEGATANADQDVQLSAYTRAVTVEGGVV